MHRPVALRAFPSWGLVLCTDLLYIVVFVAIYNLTYMSLTTRKRVTQRMERTPTCTCCPVVLDMSGEGVRYVGQCRK